MGGAAGVELKWEGVGLKGEVGLMREGWG